MRKPIALPLTIVAIPLMVVRYGFTDENRDDG